MQIIRLAAILFVVVWNSVAVAAEPIKVVIWDEQQPAQKKQYPNFLGNYIANYLKSQEGLRVRTVSIDDPKKGLSDDVLDNCDVLIWWGHVRNGDISEAEAKPVIDRLKAGKLSLLALHSAHWATPFVVAMQERAASDALAKLPEAERKTAKVEFLGEIVRRPPGRDAPLTPSAVYEKQADGTTLIKITRPNCCFPAYKNHGKPSEMRTLSPDHPIAVGIPKTFTLAHTEMYDEAFHVPKPDAVVFEEHWEEGHHFRSGMVWNVGKGRVFYFRPGHETHAVFVEKLPLKIVENAVRWLGTKKQPLPELKVGKPISLFDGETLNGWTKQDGSPVIDGWTVADGTIHQENRGGNIFYEQQVGDFELSFEWKIEKGGNNGLKYRVRKYGGSELGCEYQLLGETSRNLNKGSCGSLYALYEPNEKKKLNPNGEWNTAKIVAHGPHIEHWMNGEKIVTADLASEEWRRRLSQSKFSPYKDFARNTQGRIMLTDHGSKVWYRNLTLTPLPDTEIPPIAPDPPPNIVYIMSDELAYYEVSHMGNPHIRTPNIDRMAKEGLRFTQALAAAPVCAPLRCALMTGKHMGHASVRANGGGTPLRADEATIASLLKQKGYATGGFGKWGAGGRDSTGVPEKHGFDVFYGYYDQVHAHSFYPPYLIRNSEEVVLKGNKGGREGETYSHYAIVDEAEKFIRENKDRPFFCYLPITPPHGMYDIPADDPAWKLYADDEWMKDENISQDTKNYAAMVSMVDGNLQRVIDLLKELSLEENTIVFFTGDNGGQDRFRSKEHPRGFYGPNVNPKTGVQFRGGKGNLYEGGLRIPFLVRWPGKIKPGRVSDLLCNQVDVLPTLVELAGVKSPADADGLSILPEILGEEAVGRKQEQHEFLYWEFGSQTAVRMADWKAIQPKKDGSWELYDLSKDISEASNIADQHPEILATMKKFAEQSHVPVQAGTFSDQTRHQRDRQAKWGSTRPPMPAQRGKVNRIKEKNLIPFDQMKLISFSSENRGNDRRAAYAIDGNPRSVWHSQFSGTLAKHPHELVIDLGKVREIRGFRYLARQDGGWNGAFAKTEFSVSDSPKTFPEAAAQATFKKVRTAQAVDIGKPVRGRYVRVRVLSEVNGEVWASAAEIGIVGD
jgi:arylsulfatase A-like enzyme/trehalose utilization protein